MIKDSGDRTMLPSGAVRDLHGEDKGRMDLLPWAAIIEVSKQCEGRTLEEYANANLRDKTMRMLREGLF